MAHLSQSEVLANRVQEALVGSEIVLLNTIMNLTEDVRPGRSSVQLPIASGLAATDVPTDGSDATGSDMATTGDTLNLDQHKEVHTYIKLKDWKQASVDLETQFGEDAPKLMAEQFETLIGTTLETSGFSGHDFASGAEDSYTIGNVTEAKRLLDTAKVPKKDRYLAVDATGMSIIAAWTEFQDGSKSLSDEALKEGVVSQIKGFKVVQSEDISNNKMVCYHKSAVAFAFQGEIDYDKEYQASKSRTYLSIKALYGCKKLDGGKRQVVITQTNAS